MLINLKVEFKDKDKVKSLGARWDYERKTWFIVNVEDLTPFMEWIDKDYAPEVQHTKKQFKVNERFWARTGPEVFTPMCDCDVLPWEDCRHTEYLANAAMHNILFT
jgi:hypothetical protein